MPRGDSGRLRARVLLAIDGLLIVLLAGALVLPLVVITATPTGAVPHAAALPPVADGPSATLRTFPVFATSAARARVRAAADRPAALQALARAAVETAVGRSAARVLSGGGVPPTTARQRPAYVDAAAALTVLAAVRGRDALSPVVALTARRLYLAAGGCDGALGAAFTYYAAVDTAGLRQSEGVPSSAAAAERACPADPTPLWLRAQGEDAVALDLTARTTLPELLAASPAIVTARTVQRRWPRSPVGWALEADVLVRTVGEQAKVAPFTYRSLLRRAQALDERAIGLGPSAELETARASVLLRLGQPASAAEQLRAVDRARPAHAAVLAREVDALEQAGRLDEAADAASAQLAARPADPTELYPSGDVLDEAVGPQSYGVLGRSAELVTAVAEQGSSSPALPQDLDFIPRFRDVAGVTGSLRPCPRTARARDLIAAGRAERALDLWDARLESECAARQGHDPATLRALALLASGRPVPTGLVEGSPSEVHAHLLADEQNLLRWAHDLAGAAAVTAQWSHSAPTDPAAPLQAAEVAFLRQRWGEAQRHAIESAALATGRSAASLLNRGRAELVAGAATNAAHAGPSASRVLRAADVDLAAAARQAASEEDSDLQGAALQYRYDALLQLGERALTDRHPAAAALAYAAARQLRSEASEDVVRASRPEVLLTGAAIAATEQGQYDQALRDVDSALAQDPLSPVFLLNEAYVQRRAGRSREAEGSYRRALAADPTTATAAVDLGALLLRRGDAAAALPVLKQAVTADPHSASGWHDLGIALSRGGWSTALQAQAAFARAVRESKAFRDREREPVADDALIVTRLDLSKPLPPEWAFARSEQRVPATALLVVVLIGGVQWLRTRLHDKVVDRVQDRAVERVTRLPRLPALGPPVLGSAASLLVLLVPVVRSDLSGPEKVVTALATGGLLAALMRVRPRVAHGPVRHVTWTPGLLVGAAGSFAGLGGFAPVPAAAGAGTRRVHRAGPLLLFGVGLVLLLLATVTDVPVARTLSGSALGMGAVCLLPHEPFDGAHVGAPRLLRVVKLLLLAVAVLLALGLV